MSTSFLLAPKSINILCFVLQCWYFCPWIFLLRKLSWPIRYFWRWSLASLSVAIREVGGDKVFSSVWILSKFALVGWILVGIVGFDFCQRIRPFFTLHNFFTTVNMGDPWNLVFQPCWTIPKKFASLSHESQYLKGGLTSNGSRGLVHSDEHRLMIKKTLF